MPPPPESTATAPPDAARVPKQPGTADPRVVRAGLAVGAAALLGLGHGLRFLSQVNDDAFITYRFSRGLVEGRGPYFNPGEHIEGYTNFLWMLLLAPLVRLVGPDALPRVAQFGGLLAQVAALALGAWLARGLARRTGAADHVSDGAAFLAGLLAASSPGLAVNATTGLETGFYALLFTAAVLVSTREIERGRGSWGALLFGLAYLTRPEAAPLFALFWAARAILRIADSEPSARRDGWRHLLADGALFGLIVALHLLMRQALYDGEWLPNTYFAKRGGFAGIPRLAYIYGGVATPLLGLVGMAAGLCGVGLMARRARVVLPAATVAVAALLLPLWSGSDWMPGQRFVVPYLPVATAVAVAGWRQLASRWIEAWPRAVATALLLGTAMILAAAHSQDAPLRAGLALRARGYATGHAALAAWLEQASHPGDAVALMDIGLVGYRLPERRIIDISGLTDRVIAKSPGEFLDKQYDPEYVLGRQPRYVVLTFWAPGPAYAALAPEERLRPWTPIERRLFVAPSFQRDYCRAVVAASDGDPLAALAGRIGASRVFESAHPGRHYYLALYERGSGVARGVDQAGRAQAGGPSR